MSSAAPSRAARARALLAETVRYEVPDLGKMHRLLPEPFEFKKPAKSISLYARVFVMAHAAFRAAHLAHLVSPGARPPYPVYGMPTSNAALRLNQLRSHMRTTIQSSSRKSSHGRTA